MGLLLLYFFLSIVELQAQPGWIDFTQHYHYTILDQHGEKIQFDGNKKFSIRINDKTYTHDSIPHDSLTPPIEDITSEFYRHISINDFSLKLPLKYNQFEIQIISKEGVMHFNQESSPFKGGKKLTFIPGHYYFPHWSDPIFHNLPTPKGAVKLMNVEQTHFIIPPKLYNTIFVSGSGERALIKEKEEVVIQNFSKGFFKVKKEIVPTTFNKDFAPYKRPHWETKFHKTKIPHQYLGQIEYTMDTTNLYSSRRVFARYDHNKNHVTHWYPRESLHLFYNAKFLVDTFNHVLYQTIGQRDELKAPCTIWNDNDCPYELKVYASVDEGMSWQVDTALSNLFQAYRFRKYHFLDDQYSMGFLLRQSKNKRKYRYQRGTYALIKNKVVVDSLQTPEGVHYNGNYNRFGFTVQHDSSYKLGPWGIDYRNYKAPFQQPFISKQNGKWTFHETTTNRSQHAPIAKPKQPLRTFQHFAIQHEKDLIFDNGVGSLFLPHNVVNNAHENGIYIMEQGNCIYLIDNQHLFTYLSFDSGKTWYLYPQPLEDRSSYSFLQVNENQRISFLNKWVMHQVFYEFE